jgi:hypothetical protein
MPTTNAEVDGLWEDCGDFLGVRFDYKRRTMKLTKKTLEKIRMIDAIDSGFRSVYKNIPGNPVPTSTSSNGF